MCITFAVTAVAVIQLVELDAHGFTLLLVRVVCSYCNLIAGLARHGMHTYPAL